MGVAAAPPPTPINIKATVASLRKRNTLRFTLYHTYKTTPLFFFFTSHSFLPLFVLRFANFTEDNRDLWVCVCVCVCVPREWFLGYCWSHHRQTWHGDCLSYENASRVHYIHLDLHRNHENTKCFIISETIQAMPIKLAVQIVRVKVYMTIASPLTLTFMQDHKWVLNVTTF